MISETKRRVLAAACGVCWHDFSGSTDCRKCGKAKWPLGHDITENLDFSTPDDWELVRTNVVVPNLDDFDLWLHEKHGRVNRFRWFLTLSPEECCQLAADFLRRDEAAIKAVERGEK